MGILDFITTIFKKKEKHVGYWYLVDFTDAAKEYSVGNDFCKKIYIMYDKQWTGKSWLYSEARIQQLKQQGNAVVDKTQGQIVPAESTMIPRTEAAFGTIQIYKRIG